MPKLIHGGTLLVEKDFTLRKKDFTLRKKDLIFSADCGKIMVNQKKKGR